MRTDRNQRGSLLLVVMCLMFIMTAVIIGWPSGNRPHHVGGWLSATITDSLQINRKIAHTAAFYLAEAGAEHAKEYLSTQANLRSTIIRTAGTIPASTVLGASSVSFGAGSYTASVNVALGSWSIPLYTIASVGTADPDGRAGSGDEVRRKVIVKASLGSFARYAYFTNSEPSNIWFITTDALLGLVHTNGSFHISGRPDFWGKVSSVGSTFSFYNNGNTITSTSDHNGTRDVPLLRDGYELSATSVFYPTDVTDIQTAASGANGLLINWDARITLGVGAGNAGTITYMQTKTATWSGWNPEHTVFHSTYKKETYTILPSYSANVFDSENSPSGKAVVYVNGAAEVSGTLAGQLTILTKGDLNVTGDILYRVDPVDYDGDGLLSDADGDGTNDAGFDRNGDGQLTLNGEKADDTDDNGDGTADTTGYNQPESTDTLGLVAKGDVVVTDTGGTGVNRKIAGTVMALGTSDRTGTGTGSFRVENYDDGDIQGTLTIVGGLIQKQRGAVGTFNGDTKTSGYSKKYIYDRRVLYFPPPFFPPTNMFDLIYWQEVAL